MPQCDQGMKVLGTPLGQPEFVKVFLEGVIRKHGKLADMVTKVGDVQCAWLLMFYCVKNRANYYCRTVPPDQSSDFASAHDKQLWECLGGILNIDVELIQEPWKILGALPITKGGLSLRSAFETRTSAYWASWADCLEMIQKRHPDIAASVLEGLHRNEGVVAACKTELELLGCALPTWTDCINGARPKQQEVNGEDLGCFKYGWQHHVVTVFDTNRRSEIWNDFSRRHQAHIRSQSGPGVHSTFCVFYCFVVCVLTCLLSNVVVNVTIFLTL